MKPEIISQIWYRPHNNKMNHMVTLLHSYVQWQPDCVYIEYGPPTKYNKLSQHCLGNLQKHQQQTCLTDMIGQ